MPLGDAARNGETDAKTAGSPLHFDHSIICVFEMQAQKIPCLQPEEAFCFIAAAATLRGANRGRHRRTGRFMGQLLCYSEIREQKF